DLPPRSRKKSRKDRKFLIETFLSFTVPPDSATPRKVRPSGRYRGSRLLEVKCLGPCAVHAQAEDAQTERHTLGTLSTRDLFADAWRGAFRTPSNREQEPSLSVTHFSFTQASLNAACF